MLRPELFNGERHEMSPGVDFAVPSNKVYVLTENVGEEDTYELPWPNAELSVEASLGESWTSAELYSWSTFAILFKEISALMSCKPEAYSLKVKDSHPKYYVLCTSRKGENNGTQDKL